MVVDPGKVLNYGADMEYPHTAVVENDTVDAHNSANIISEVAIVTSQSLPVSTSTAFTGTQLRLQ